MMSLLTFVLFYVLVFVRAVPLTKRIVVSPPITYPTTSTTWNVGEQVTVTWDTSSIPPPGNFTGQLLIGFITPGSENLDVDNPLAQNFPLSAGSVQITVPNVPNGSNYIVVLFGDSGNASPQFTITGGSGTTETPSPTAAPTPTTSSSPPVSPPPSSPAPASPNSPAPVPSTTTTTPTYPNPTTPGSPVPPAVSPSSSSTTTTTSATGATSPSSNNPVAKSSSSNSALPALHACGAHAIFLCAAAAAMSLLVVL